MSDARRVVSALLLSLALHGGVLAILHRLGFEWRTSTSIERLVVDLIEPVVVSGERGPRTAADLEAQPRPIPRAWRDVRLAGDANAATRGLPRGEESSGANAGESRAPVPPLGPGPLERATVPAPPTPPSPPAPVRSAAPLESAIPNPSVAAPPRVTLGWEAGAASGPPSGATTAGPDSPPAPDGLARHLVALPPGEGGIRGEGGGKGGPASGAAAGRPTELAARPGGGGAPIPPEYEGYVRALRQRIQDRLVYPWLAVRQRIHGVVDVEVHVDSEGRLAGVSAVGGERKGILREAALRAVREAAPFPFPAGIPSRPLTIRLPVVFELR